ncbi:MAG TPA: TetR/AcrR family transcriptional regulator [Candidatus Glassbacteria bacterium]|nr:TetR/AcrR family transcriptional regulator [Candidatus Glassbacteria bacterium]
MTRKAKGLQDPSTRDKIIDAARAEFIDHGYDGARMQRIAGQSGANKAMIYYYFGNKRELYRQIFRQVVGREFRNIIGIMKEDLPPEQKIRGLVERYVNLYRGNPGLVRLLMREIADEGDVLAGVLEEFGRALEGFDYVGSVRKILQSENCRPLDARHTLMSLIGMCAAYFFFRPVADYVLEIPAGQSGKFARERSGQVADLILFGVMKSKGGGSGSAEKN